MKLKTIIILLILIILTIFFYKKMKSKEKDILAFYTPKFFKFSEFDTTATQQDLENGVKTYTNKRGAVKVYGSGKKNMRRSAILMLDKARKIIEDGYNKINPHKKIVFIINSGYRSEQYNKQISGARNSAHILGRAFDISLKNYDLEQKKEILRALYIAGFRRFGVGSSFVHVDNAHKDTGHNTPAFWTYYNPFVNSINDIKNLV